MKKFVIVVLLFIVMTFFIIEKKQTSPKTVGIKNTDKIVLKKDSEKRAIFLSYIEYGTYLKGKNEETKKENLIKILDNIKNNGFNMLIFHVRSFSDAIYPSKIFPWSATVSNIEGESPGFDILDFIVKEAHKRKIEVHAWVNPYRIRTTSDISTISKKNPAYKWLNTANVKVINDVGIFYNPASSDVQDLIVKGIEEIVENYNVDGIHFDDYFYPSKEIDEDDYLRYQKDGGEMTIDEYRLNNVNKMIKRVYEVIKKHDQNILFGVSPEGNIDNNYQLNYADTKRWASEKGYVDYLMPQIYFGFENERRPFIETVTMWNEIITNEEVKLLPALAFYKVGLEDINALSGANEWIENSDIMKKEVLVSRNLSQYDGFSLFRYDYLFQDKLKTETTSKELENLKDIIIAA